MIPLKLLINGRMLHWSDVGLGVYTARLLRGLARHAQDSEVVCLAPAGCDFSFPPGIKVIYRKRLLLPKLLADVAFDCVVDWIARKEFPYHIIFHPFPTSFASRPEKTCVVYHDCIPVHVPIYLGRKVVRRLIARHRDAVGRHCEDREVSKAILKHLGLWLVKSKPAPQAHVPPVLNQHGSGQAR